MCLVETGTGKLGYFYSVSLPPGHSASNQSHKWLKEAGGRLPGD